MFYDENYQFYLNQIKQSLILNHVEEQILIKEIKHGNQSAREKLIMANQKLVIKIALKYQSYNFDLMDLIQEGNFGLIKAIERFDCKKKLRFSTYAYWWIKSSISHYIIKTKYCMDRSHRNPIDLNIVPIDGLEIMADIRTQPDEMVFRKQLRKYILKIFNSFSQQESYILQSRCYDMPKISLSEVAGVLGCSDEHIRQMARKLLKVIKIRYSRDLKNFISS